MGSFELDSVTLPNGVEISRGTEIIVREPVAYGDPLDSTVIDAGEILEVQSLEYSSGNTEGEILVHFGENSPLSVLALGDGTKDGFTGHIHNGRFMIVTR